MNTIKKSLVAATVVAAFGAGAASAATIATFNLNVNIDSTLYGPMDIVDQTGAHGGTGTGSLDSDGSISMITNEHLQTIMGTNTITDATYTIPSLGGSDASSHVFACQDVAPVAVAACPSVILNPDFLGGVTAGAVPDGVGDSFTLTFSGASVTQRTFTLTSWEPAAVVPVPAAAWLFGSGLLGLAGAARRRRAAA